MLHSCRSALSSKLEEKEKQQESFQKHIRDLEELLERAVKGNTSLSKRIGEDKANTASEMYVLCIFNTQYIHEIFDDTRKYIHDYFGIAIVMILQYCSECILYINSTVKDWLQHFLFCPQNKSNSFAFIGLI